ncbi:hypothetical protein E1B28_002421 [Marasmius oreades]|uniref:Mitochondrial adapter protein MCP1 transmembrane domain-containing protein n=1 Tax=Marasmius oreades TaxID=181124 RepID=A0A9P7RNM0_9AGAR|nr:uncharacterized protein E1B28_002421 [Marasmius oreades]KAG7086470.1 hypothetical protein E1B28_002421 [Marasmius oreades]
MVSFSSLLTNLNHGSAPFISTFLLIHLTAPALANVGGSEMASQVMILGREYYQTSFGEKYLLLGPIIVHSLSGITRRLLAPGKPISLVHLAAYPLLLLAPIHFLTHRAIPALPSEPISSLSPSELDYQFVVHHLHKYPVVSWTLYGALILTTIVHAVEGAVVVWNTWTPKMRVNQQGKTRSVRLAAALMAFGGPVLSGVYVLSRELPFLLKGMAERFDAVLRSVPIYRLE